MLLLSPPCGTHHVDRFELAELAELADTLLAHSIILSGEHVGLALLTDDEGGAHFAPNTSTHTAPGDEPQIGMTAYAAAIRRNQLRTIDLPSPRRTGRPDDPASGTFPGLREQGRNPVPFTPLSDMNPPGHLLTADALFREHFGTGMDGLKAVLGTAVDWPAAEVPAIAHRDDLAREAQEWSGLERSEIDAAIDLLSLHPEQLRQEDFRY